MANKKQLEARIKRQDKVIERLRLELDQPTYEFKGDMFFPLHVAPTILGRIEAIESHLGIKAEIQTATKATVKVTKVKASKK